MKVKRGRESKHPPHPKGCYIVMFKSMRAERDREGINTHLQDVISCSLFESMHIWLFIRGIGIFMFYFPKARKGEENCFTRKTLIIYIYE